MEKIFDGDLLLAIVYRDADWSPGLNFCTPDELFIQAGTWFYPAGKVLQAHKHKVNERRVTHTQEVVYVKSGSMRISIFTDEGRLLKSVVLEAGDFAVMAYGGHGYEILQEGTKILEVKNGPFIDVSSDKVLL